MRHFMTPKNQVTPKSEQSLHFFVTFFIPLVFFLLTNEAQNMGKDTREAQFLEKPEQLRTGELCAGRINET